MDGMRMVQNYKRKTTRGSYGSNAIQQALLAISEGLSLKKALVDHNVPRATLRRHRDSKTKCPGTVKFGSFEPVLCTEFERELASQKAKKGFETTGLWPYDDRRFTDADFSAAELTDEPFPTVMPSLHPDALPAAVAANSSLQAETHPLSSTETLSHKDPVSESRPTTSLSEPPPPTLDETASLALDAATFDPGCALAESSGMALTVSVSEAAACEPHPGLEKARAILAELSPRPKLKSPRPRTRIGASYESRTSDLAKLKNLSSTMYRQQVMDAARQTYCFRSQDIAKNLPTFKLCAQSYPCYVSLPQIILQDFDCKFPLAKDRCVTAFDATIVPATLKMARASRNDDIRVLSTMPSGADGMDAAIRCVKILIGVLPTPGKARQSAVDAFSKLVCILQIPW